MFQASIKIFRKSIWNGQGFNTDGELLAIAPLESLDAVSKAVAERNIEADEARTGMYYYFERGAAIKVFQPGDAVKIP